MLLEKNGFGEDLIIRLIERKQPSSEEVEKLSHFENIAVIHLLSSNPSIPQSLIHRFSQHKSFEVRTGIASNPKTPLNVLQVLRTPGKYTTMNDYIARNPNITSDLLWEMHRNGEARYTSLGLNPNCERNKYAHKDFSAYDYRSSGR